MGGPSPNFGLGVELGGRVWYPMKVLLIRNNLCAGTETLSLSVYEPLVMQFFAWGTVPQFWVGVGQGGQVWYNVKVFRIRYNLFAGTETLSLSLFTSQSQYTFCLGGDPKYGGAG